MEAFVVKDTEQAGMADTDVFEKLADAGAKIREGLSTILENAPNLDLYRILVENESSPFLQNTLNIGDGDVKLNDQSIKFAVTVKELYEKGQLDIVRKLVDGEVDDLLIRNDGEETENENREEVGDVGEINTKMNQMQLFNHNGDPLKAVFKRNREFEIFKDDNPPTLPVINEPELLAKVFTHQSILNCLNIPEEDKVKSHNERLEFLGDAFLQFVSSMIIYERFPNFSEGQLSILRSQIVSNSRLLKLSQLYKFDKQLRKNFNDSSILLGSSKIYADVFEAYLGAIAEQYMLETVEGETRTDTFMKGWFEAKQWIEELCEEQFQNFDESIVFKMQYSKSSKQDLRMLLGQEVIPEYVRCNLPNRRMMSCVKVGSKIYGYGIGTSNKEADARAAVDCMSNPGLKKMCPPDNWKRFEDLVGLNGDGGLKFEQYETLVTADELKILEHEVVFKYKSGKIKFLVSHNNKNQVLVDEKVRKTIVAEMDSKFSLDNTEGEMMAEGGSIEGKPVENVGSSVDEDSTKTKTRTTTAISRSSKSSRSSTSQSENRDGDADNDEQKEKYYPKHFTMGRGGVFKPDEFTKVRIGKSKEKGGIARNKVFEIIEREVNVDEEGEGDYEDKVMTKHTMVKIRCHEVLVDVDDIDMNSRNHMNGIYMRRGASPRYVFHQTSDDMFLCELWFGQEQIVGYGFDRNKKMAAQKAAMLAWKREDFYGDDSSSDGDGDAGADNTD